MLNLLRDTAICPYVSYKYGTLKHRTVKNPAVLFRYSGVATPLLLPAGREGKGARLPRAANAAPFAHQAPLPEQVGLHVHPVVAVHALGRVDAVEDDGIHALSLDMVL